MGCSVTWGPQPEDQCKDIRGRRLPPCLQTHLRAGGGGNHTEGNIYAGEMAERLFQIYITVNKSSICPNDKSCSRGRARGHQTRVTSCSCCCHPRRGAVGRMGDSGAGRCWNLLLQLSTECPRTPLTALSMAKCLSPLQLIAPASLSPTSLCAPHRYLEIPALLKPPPTATDYWAEPKNTWNTHSVLKNSIGAPSSFSIHAQEAQQRVTWILATPLLTWHTDWN